MGRKSGIPDHLDPEEILAASLDVREVVGRHVRRTPLLHSEWLSHASGREVYLKCENLQITGSFKVRGAFAALAAMGSEDRQRGVVTSSAGNHGAGLARAARVFDVPCTIVVPRGTPEVKLAKMRQDQAQVITAPCAGYDAAQAWTLEHVDQWGGCFISPFEHALVIAGNGGTTALEIFEDLPACDTLVVPCGGGGCSVGMGLVAHARPRRVLVLAVNTDASPGMWLSRRDGRAHLSLQSKPTIAEGLEGGVGAETFRLGLEAVDAMRLVPEADVRRAVGQIATREHLLVEGSAAVAVAALLAGDIPGQTICLLLTGANIDSQRFCELLLE